MFRDKYNLIKAENKPSFSVLPVHLLILYILRSRCNGFTETNFQHGSIDFSSSNEVALNKLEDILDALGLLADGKKVGKEFQMLNPKRNDGELGSFSINTETGAWADFATADKGGDVISLVAYITNQTQGKAKDWLVGQLGLTNTVDTPSYRNNGQNRPASRHQAVCPGTSS